MMAHIGEGDASWRKERANVKYESGMAAKNWPRRREEIAVMVNEKEKRRREKERDRERERER